MYSPYYFFCLQYSPIFCLIDNELFIERKYFINLLSSSNVPFIILFLSFKLSSNIQSTISLFNHAVNKLYLLCMYFILFVYLFIYFCSVLLYHYMIFAFFLHTLNRFYFYVCLYLLLKLFVLTEFDKKKKIIIGRYIMIIFITKLKMVLRRILLIIQMFH